MRKNTSESKIIYSVSVHILLGIALGFLGGCGGGTFKNFFRKETKMTLISNQENTAFAIRRHGGEWKNAGTGKIINVSTTPDTAYEVKAKPGGYREKSMTVNEPVSELRFTFEISDREDAAPRVVEVDVRVISVRTGEAIETARGKAGSWTHVRKAIAACASQLANSGKLKKKRLTVLNFEEGPNAANLGSQAQAMMVSHLKDGGNFNIIERQQLVKILDENDLTEADIVKNPGKLKQISSILPVDFIVLGVIGRLEN